jgi:hypothetical protein
VDVEDDGIDTDGRKHAGRVIDILENQTIMPSRLKGEG